MQEYFLQTKEIASKSAIEHEALFEYVIDGLNHDANSKAVLYGAKNIREFKDRLKVYKKIKDDRKKSNNFTKAKENAIRNTRMQRKLSKEGVRKKTVPEDSKFEERCFNCGARDHQPKEGNKKTPT